MQYLNIVLLAAAAMATEAPAYGAPAPAPVYSAIDTTCTEEVTKPTAPVYESKYSSLPVETPSYPTKSHEVPVYSSKPVPVYSSKPEAPVYSTKKPEVPVYSTKPEVPVYETSKYTPLPVETPTGTWVPVYSQPPAVYTCPPAVTVTVTVPAGPAPPPVYPTGPAPPPVYPTGPVPGGATIQTSVPAYQPTGPAAPPVYTPLPVETPGGPSPPTYPSGTPVQPPVYGTGYPAPSGTGKAPHYPSYTGAAVAINRGAAATGAGVMGAIAAFFML